MDEWRKLVSVYNSCLISISLRPFGSDPKTNPCGLEPKRTMVHDCMSMYFKYFWSIVEFWEVFYPKALILPFPPDTDSAQVSLDIIPAMSEEAIANMAVGRCFIPRLPRLYVGWRSLYWDSNNGAGWATWPPRWFLIINLEAIPPTLTRLKFPTTLLAERRDRPNDFLSSDPEPFPPDTN